MSNFMFLKGFPEFAELTEYCEDAETFMLSKPILSAISARNALEFVIKYIYKAKAGYLPSHASLFELIDSYEISNFINDQVIKDSLHYIRILGNNAAHNNKIKSSEALLGLENLHFFVGEILILLGKITDYPTFDKNSIGRSTSEKPVEVKKVEVKGEAEKVFAEGIKKDKTLSVERPAYMSEANTRKLLIDLYLKEAGWDVCEQEDVCVPGKAGIEIKVLGMPNETGEGFCDYVLYGRDGLPLAIVEAKKTSVSPEKGRHQVELYGKCMQAKYGYVPVLYYTNGYSIKIIDGIYPDRELMAYHTLVELELLLQRRKRGKITDLRIRDEITNRPYQKMAITSICEHFNANNRRGLLVMATGTGKTRVAISLVDVLTRHNWIKNVLFLADRTSLVKQAKKNFVKLMPDMTVCELSGSGEKDLNARLMFSTYQTMINCIDGDDKTFSTGRFDLIIIDEAHRSIFKKYSSIFAYYDSLLIGLTATPRDQVDANTYKIFGCESGIPNFSYDLNEAVHDGYLVPYREPLERSTTILERGILYSELSEEEKEEYEEKLFDEYGEEVGSSSIFRAVYNKSTCNRVLEVLMKEGLKIENGDKLGKTIIFAYNHKHAQMIVECFHNLYPSKGHDFCRLIDNYETYADDLIVKFETDPDFQIAVSVDMLDTGIDVPAVLNLVFFKPVKSYIKFMQMIGRGTRLCPDVFGPGKDKTEFLIFDWCHNFKFFSIPENRQQGGKAAISVTQRLFELRLDILQELQRFEQQAIPFNKDFYDKLKPMLIETIRAVRNNSSRISVRQAMAYLDKYADESVWQCISPVNAKEIKLHIAPLVEDAEKDNPYTKAFDCKMLFIELDILLSGAIARSKRDIAAIRLIAKFLLTKATIPQIMEKAQRLKEAESERFWAEPSFEKVEKLRMDIRDLMKFLDDSESITYLTDFKDEEIEVESSGAGLFDIRTYREKVIDYLAEHSDNPVISKIKNLEQLVPSDLEELEDILWNELGTKNDYIKTTKTENLAVFIRSLVGLSQQAINEKFGEYLNETVLNAQQQEFVKMIISYVNENGDIETEDLLNTSPFDDQDLLELFGEKLKILSHIVNTMHQVVQVAA